MKVIFSEESRVYCFAHDWIESVQQNIPQSVALSYLPRLEQTFPTREPDIASHCIEF